MTNDTMTNDEKINLDKLNYFYNKKIDVHIKLLRKDYNGKNIFLNGSLIEKYTDSLFLIKEKKLGELRVHILEIKPNGVFELKYEVRSE